MSAHNWLTAGRLGFIANLRSVDTFCGQTLLVAMCRSAADDIERLAECLNDAERVMAAVENQNASE